MSKFCELSAIYSYFNFYFTFKIQANRIQTNDACIKLSYPLVLPVCTDRIRVKILELMKMDWTYPKNEFVQVNNAGVVLLLSISPCIFLRSKVTSFREILKNTQTSACNIHYLKFLLQGLWRMQFNGQQQIQNSPTFSVADLKIEINTPQNHRRVYFLCLLFQPVNQIRYNL